MLLTQTSKLSAQFEEGKTVAFGFHYHTKSIIRFMNSLFTKVLSRNNIVFLQHTVETVLREMIVNAVKANSKRVYFKLQNLDINNANDYTKGMEGFKSFIINEQDRVQDELKKGAYKVNFFLTKVPDGLKVFIRNNVPLHKDEITRINSRIEKAKKYDNFADIYTDISDSSEGEGLGIPLTVLFLRNSGIGEDSFKVSSSDSLTQSSLHIPYELQPREVRTQILEQILDDINELPTFPENITRLQEMCRNPEITIRQIADTVSSDPSISSSVLRLSNSAGFVTVKRIENVQEAIKIIGLKNLASILISSSAQKIMNERYSSFKKIWEHSSRVAYYARYIALISGRAKLLDRVFLGGMLHDLGKIVLLSTNSKIAELIGDIAKNREMRNSTVIEEVAIGIGHNTIGQLIARKWNMPEYLIESIRTHQSPLNSPEEYREIVSVIYLANKLCAIEEKRFDYFYFEDSILQLFNLETQELLTDFHEDMQNKYTEEQALLFNN